MKGRLEHSLQTEQNIKRLLEELPDYVTYYYYEFKSGRQPKACLEYIRKIRRFLLYINFNPKDTNLFTKHNGNFENIAVPEYPGFSAELNILYG